MDNELVSELLCFQTLHTLRLSLRLNSRRSNRLLPEGNGRE